MSLSGVGTKSNFRNERLLANTSAFQRIRVDEEE
jgi:hypothetical protein